jgi:hypothetical protein
MPANIIKIVDLGGGGDFSSLAAFIVWLYNNYNPLDRNACAICRVSSGNTYGDSAAWGSLPSFSGYATILITTTKDHWFNGIFSSTRYYLATNPTQPTNWYNLIFHRVQIGAPNSPRTGTITAGLFLCGVVSSATTAVQSDTVANSMIVCTSSNQIAIQCQGTGVYPLITRNLIITRPGQTGYIGVRGPLVQAHCTLIIGNIFARFSTPVSFNELDWGGTYYNSTTTATINPDSEGNVKNAVFTFVDENNWNYVLSINDTGAKYLYPGYSLGGLPVSLYHNGITGYRFPNSSIGPTDPDPGSYPPWITKVVDTDGGGDFTSLNAALAWLYSNYPNLVTSNMRAKFICKGTASDSTDVTTTISTTDPVHYIHIIAHDDYRFRGTANVARLYKRSKISAGNTFHIILEGIQINQGTSSLSKSCLVIRCYVIYNAATLYGNYVNSIIQTSTENTNSGVANSLMNCTIINTTPSTGVIPNLGMSINCVAVGARLSATVHWYLALGAVTNYSSGPVSLYNKCGETILFRNSSGYDYRLSWNDTAAKQQGIYTGSYLEGVVDVELQGRPIRSSYGADEPCLECTEISYSAESARRIKFFIDRLIGADLFANRAVFERLYCVVKDVYKGALSGRILIRVQKKIARIYRI